MFEKKTKFKFLWLQKQATK